MNSTLNTLNSRDFLIDIFNHENEASYLGKDHYPFIHELAIYQRHTMINERIGKGGIMFEEAIFLMDLLIKERNNINPGRKCCNGELVCKYYKTKYARHEVIMKRISKLTDIIQQEKI